jgi:hypothetical protein
MSQITAKSKGVLCFLRTLFIQNSVACSSSLEPLADRRHIKVADRRTKQDWAEFIQERVDVHYPQVEAIVLVLDNLNIHVPWALYESFSPAEARRILEKLEIHYTPKHGN